MQDSMSYWLHAPRTFCLCPIDLTDPGQHVLLTSQTQELCPIGHWSHRCRICCVYPIDLIDPGHFMFYWPHSPRVVHPIDIKRPRKYVPLISHMLDNMSYWPHRPRTFYVLLTSQTQNSIHIPLTSKTKELCPTDLTDPGHFVYTLLTSQTQDILFMFYWPHRSRAVCPIDFKDPGIMSHWSLRCPTDLTDPGHLVLPLLFFGEIAHKRVHYYWQLYPLVNCQKRWQWTLKLSVHIPVSAHLIICWGTGLSNPGT